MKTSDFDYQLPRKLIAQHPAQRRDQARMMVLNREKNSREHRQFSDFPEFLMAGDTLVLNDTKVIPARLIGHKPTGARAEVFLLHRESADQWRCLVQPGRKLKPGDQVHFAERMVAHIVQRHDDGTRSVRFSWEGTWEEALESTGIIPLPPYIERERELPEDRRRYQTVYAQNPGAVAAPTAGLHFTPEMLEQIEAEGVRIARLTLHVGIGTFKPVTAEDIDDHTMESEWYEIGQAAAETIQAARNGGGRIIAVGTTCVRTLESAAEADGTITASSGWTDIFITPGYQFRAVDALLTNFHLPKSTLIMLVSALAGRETVLAAYEAAVREQYRFYSYGDCMLIL